MIKFLTSTDISCIFSFLSRHRLQTALLFGNINAGSLDSSSGEGNCGDYFGYFLGAELQGIMAFYSSGSCSCYFAGEAPEEMSELLVKRNLRSLHGLSPTVSQLMKHLDGRKTIRGIVENVCMFNNSCRPFLLPGTEFRTAGELGYEHSVRYISLAYREGLYDAKSLHKIKERLKTSADAGEFFFLLLDGEVKALAYSKTITGGVSQIGGVYTLEAERGKGYCKAIMYEMCKRSSQQGKIPALIVNQHNFPAKQAYQGVGFRPLENTTIIHF